VSRETWSAVLRTLELIMRHRRSSSALAAHWRAEVFRTNWWLVPGVEVLAAIALFAAR